MEGARTRGQAAALAAVAAMVRGPAPQAVLLVGPDGVGKTTLALDLAAGLLCTAAPADRPCRQCRACRLVEHGTHPDLHRLGPAGPGRQVVIGGPDAKYRGVKDLIGDLSLMPVEGGARVAIIEAADRMNEDAQSALLKTLEEPPAGVTIILCADAEARLLPTVRSRCFRVRLGLVGPRDIEAIVADHGLADPPTAARLGRLAGGRPGLALAYARTPEAVLLRAELTRVLLDMTDAGPGVRLAAARAAVPRAIALSVALSSGPADAATAGERRPPSTGRAATSGRGRAAGRAPGRRSRAPTRTTIPPRTRTTPSRVPPGRRPSSGDGAWRSSSACGRTWRATSSSSRRAVRRSVRDTVLLDELASIAATIDPADAEAFLARAARSAEWLATNVSPELILDTLVLAWPRRSVAAA